MESEMIRFCSESYTIEYGWKLRWWDFTGKVTLIKETCIKFLSESHIGESYIHKTHVCESNVG